jgi:hypothetical protein
MFGIFGKKSALETILAHIDRQGPEFLTSATGYGGDSERALLYESIRDLDDASIFEEAASLIRRSDARRRRQLFTIQWFIACRREDRRMQQWMIDAYYSETDEVVAAHLRNLFCRAHAYHKDSPWGFYCFDAALDLRAQEGVNVSHEARYLELVCDLFFKLKHEFKRNPPGNTDFYDVATRLTRYRGSSKHTHGYVDHPNILAAIGAYGNCGDMAIFLRYELSAATDEDKRVALACAIANYFPIEAEDAVTATLLEAASKRGGNQHSVLRALRYAPREEVEDALIALLDKSSLSLSNTGAILQTLADLGSQKVVPYALEFLQHSKRDIRWIALQTLPRTDEYIPHWIAVLAKDRDPFLKGLALMGLLDKKTPEVCAAIFAFARKAAKTKVGSNLSANTYLSPALQYLASFSENKAIVDFLRALPPELLQAPITGETALTDSLIKG